mmetsp:Transcript_18044/g.40023  ORF Transcript_18044/g.40023 Transcript_18044/m.40023 type:complete len:278 (-) Transcript_18044:146-979(-)
MGVPPDDEPTPASPVSLSEATDFQNSTPLLTSLSESQSPPVTSRAVTISSTSLALFLRGAVASDEDRSRSGPAAIVSSMVFPPFSLVSSSSPLLSRLQILASTTLTRLLPMTANAEPDASSPARTRADRSPPGTRLKRAPEPPPAAPLVPPDCDVSPTALLTAPWSLDLLPPVVLLVDLPLSLAVPVLALVVMKVDRPINPASASSSRLPRRERLLARRRAAAAAAVPTAAPAAPPPPPRDSALNRMVSGKWDGGSSLRRLTRRMVVVVVPAPAAAP